jgi:dTDP-4-amino-4,6-dideoxygalactose transaminase
MYKSLETANPLNIPIAKNMSERVICLPLYPDLDAETVYRITNIIDNAI